MRPSRALSLTVFAFVLLSATTVASVTTTTSAAFAAPSAPTARDLKTPALSHVFVIVGENTSFRDVTAKHAPFLVGTLKPRSALARWLSRLVEQLVARRLHRDDVRPVDRVRTG